MKNTITIITCVIFLLLAHPVFAKEKLAVMELEAMRGVDESLVEVLTDVLKDELDAAGEYSIISREEIEVLANRLALQQKAGTCTTSDCLADMGKALGTKLMVYGSISKLGNTYSISLRLLNTESKEAVRRVREHCKCSEEELLDTVQLAANKIMGVKQSRPRLKSIVTKQNPEASLKVGINLKKTVPNLNGPSSKVWKEPDTGLEFVRISGGCYSMGGKHNGFFTADRKVNTFNHQVCLDDFYIAKYEMDQKIWTDIIGKNPSDLPRKTLFGDYDLTKYPVESVSWEDIQVFVKELNSKTKMNFRLPSEAEWEYAARSGGKKELFSGGDRFEDLAWGGGGDPYAELRSLYYSANTTHKIDTKNPNGLGLFLMSGNVAEWCSDWYEEDYYKGSPANNPKGPENGLEKVVRGGSWYSTPSDLMTFDRSHAKPNVKSNRIGFRLVHPAE